MEKEAKKDPSEDFSTVIGTGTAMMTICRLRQQFDETVEHIISACSMSVKEQYMKITYKFSLNYTLTYERN